LDLGEEKKLRKTFVIVVYGGKNPKVGKLNENYLCREAFT